VRELPLKREEGIGVRFRPLRKLRVTVLRIGVGPSFKCHRLETARNPKGFHAYPFETDGGRNFKERKFI
jgi:hypothetical protein